MVFPATPLPVKVELDLTGDWTSPTDITSKVYFRDGIHISRGKSSETSNIDPANLTLTLNNRDGSFSPRNPLGPYYGSLKRNTRIRLSVLAGNVRAISSNPTVSDVNFATVDSVATSITGDIDLRIDAKTAWRNGHGRPLAVKYADPSNRSWYIQLNPSGTITFFWSATGSTLLSAESTVPIPYPVYGRKAIRVTLDVNNGASGNTTTFYTSDTIAGSWTQLGDPVIKAGTTSIFNGTASTAVYLDNSELYGFEMYGSITGASLVASPDFDGQSEGTTSFSDAQGNPWITSTGAIITARRYRFYGEVASWPQSWDSSGRDIYVPITANGSLRRINQSQVTQLRDSIYRQAVQEGAVAYWPLTDPAGTRDAVSGIGGESLRYRDFSSSLVVSGRPAYGDGTLYSYLPPVMAVAKQPTGTFSGGNLQANIAPTTAASNYAFDILYRANQGENDTDLPMDTEFFLYMSNNVRWHWRPTTNFTQIEVAAYTRAGVFIGGSSISAGTLFNGDVHHVRLAVADAGGTSATWTLYIDGTSIGSNTINTGVSNTAYPVIQALDYFSDSIQHHVASVYLGHIVVWSGTFPSVTDAYSAATGHLDETAAERIQRLCDEEGIPFFLIGDVDDSALMAPQSLSPLVNLLQECIDADQGMLIEPRNNHGLVYRTRVSLHNQDTTVTLDYDSQHLSVLTPVDDDQFVRNDIKLSRSSDGSNFETSLDTGALSTLDSPNGVGRYLEDTQINLSIDDSLPDYAGWKLHLGTTDEPRYPDIGVDLTRNAFVSSASLRTSVLDADIGDVISITDLPTWVNYDDVIELIYSTAEDLSNFEHSVRYGTQPGSPWKVAIYDNDNFRYHSNGSTLIAGVNSSATALSVATTSGPLWTTSAGDMPFDIIVSGERMTVTAISGASSPQTFTVTRSVNGVVKSLPINSEVDLFQPSFYAI